MNVCDEQCIDPTTVESIKRVVVLKELIFVRGRRLRYLEFKVKSDKCRGLGKVLQEFRRRIERVSG